MLLPTLCPQCRQPVTLSLDEALQVDPGADGPLQVWHEVGCPACAAERGPFSPPGTAELIALHEVILIDEASRPVFERYLDGGQLDNPLPADHVSLPEVARDLLRRGIAGLDTYRREILQNPTLRMQHQWELERRRGADAQERLQRLRRFFSPAVAELILSGAADDPTRTRRREIVVLFLDLRGFTGFAETNDPEDVMRVLRDYHAAMGELIVDQKATLERFAGDGMMVFLNDPLPVSEPAREAVRLAMRMQERFVALQAEWQRLGIELGLGIGVAQGYATLGPIGYEGRRDYGAIGTVTNLAARLCGEASSGQILVSQRVRGHLGEGFTCEAVGPLQLKGFHAPVPAHAVSWQAAA
jgi:class 3 adenylate cyclase